MGRRQGFCAIGSFLVFVSIVCLGEAFVLSGFGVGMSGTCRLVSDGPQRTESHVSLLKAGKTGENHAAPSIAKTSTPPVLSVPVFSLSTVNEDGTTNMNIVTYASPVGIEPERLWMVSLYKSTLSHDNFSREGWGVLQLLQKKHAPLVAILGKSSGRDTDKARRCAQEAFPWEEPSPEVLSAPKKIAIVPDCAALITLGMVSKQPAGDHDAIICRVVGTAEPEKGRREPPDSEPETLETRHLREAGII